MATANYVRKDTPIYSAYQTIDDTPIQTTYEGVIIPNPNDWIVTEPGGNVSRMGDIEFQLTFAATT